MTQEDHLIVAIQEEHKRNPVIKESLSPILLLLKLFGLYHEEKLSKSSKWKHKLSKIYSYVAMLLFLAAIGRSIAAMFFGRNKEDYFAIFVFIVCYLKCIGNLIACMRISPCSKSTQLYQFVDELQEFLDSIKLNQCRRQENNFKAKLQIWLLIFILIFFTSVGVNIFVMLYPIVNPDKEIGPVILPFPRTLPTCVAKILLDTLEYGVRLFPVALCGILTQSLSYVFSEFYRYLKVKERDGLCLRSYIKEIREKYVAMTTMCTQLDDLIALLMLVSYLTDIILVCLMLRICVFAVSGIARVVVLCWTLPCVFSLLSISFYASQLVDKGGEMCTFIQKLDIINVNLDAKIQLDLLLFHLNSQPVVLTIWKMIPLNKSIIISIFVSIITYFTIIITF
ncbi:uncharacterized protein LOC130654810 [Hydractinia symbiolongicarpus]|uniref:uncharacterized protein LOC130654810 n=1 Tax=Hydractinia symbiolongicarpus TaxID=13093 RepID=UPI00254B6FFC|nr:uncharacterized protein LOC130654810 [Hydractinia symbiolongicarpus]